MKREIKRIVAVLFMAVVALTPIAANAAIVLDDNFDSYADGTLAGQGNWLVTGSSVTTPIQVAGVGDKYAQVNSSGQDIYKALSSSVLHLDGQGLHTSIDIFVTAASVGEYFFHVSDPVATTTNFYQRLQVRSSGVGFQLGMLGASGTGSSTAWGATVLNFSQTYDVDIEWNFVVGTQNDTFDVTVDGGNYVTHTWNSTTVQEPAQITAVNLRQGTATNAPTLQVDNITVEGVPEPGTLSLIAAGALLGLRRRK